MTDLIERTRASLRGMEIAPLRGLRYDLGKTGPGGAEAVTSPPYDVISPEDHARLLAASPHNITRVTLGETPGDVSSYEERAELLRRWIRDGILTAEAEPSFYVTTIDYAVPGVPSPSAPRARFLGLIALGRLRAFDEGVVLPHEKTFPRVVEDRLRLLDATRTNLENILLLYSDPEGSIDRILRERCRGRPALRVEAKPGEFHAIHPFSDVAAFIELTQLFQRQRPIIADGHHRYTTSLRFAREARDGGKRVPGSDWQMMTFANLFGEGLSILATHRLVKLRTAGSRPATAGSRPATAGSRPATGSMPGATGGTAASGTAASERACPPALVDEAVASLLSRLEEVDDGSEHFRIETGERSVGVRFPRPVIESRSGVARTSYALLHDVVLGDWLADRTEGEASILYFKEGTGEREALARGDGDILFRMRPVDPNEFESVVQGGEVFPHKTTYFYPKLQSGLVLWRVEDPERLALK